MEHFPLAAWKILTEFWVILKHFRNRSTDEHKKLAREKFLRKRQEYKQALPQSTCLDTTVREVCIGTIPSYCIWLKHLSH